MGRQGILMKTAFLTFVLAFIAVNQLAAQLNGVNKGDQVRVTVASVEKTTVTGDVKDVTATELKLVSVDFGLLAIPVMEIERLEVRTRISKTARGAIMGGARRNQWWKIVPIDISPASKASGKARQHLPPGFAIKGKINF